MDGIRRPRDRRKDSNKRIGDTGHWHGSKNRKRRGDTQTLGSGSNHDSFRFSFDLFAVIRAPTAVFAFTFRDLLASKMPPERINTLKWESNGELSAHDVFELVKRLKHEEQPARSSQLLQLVNKHRHSSKAKKAAPRAAS